MRWKAGWMLKKRVLWCVAGASAAAVIAVSVRHQRRHATSAPALRGDEVVLALVDGSPITEYDVERTVQGSLGDYTQSQLGKDGRRKVLESLVAGRAIARAQKAKLSPERSLELERKVEAFREQLLVNEYLKANSAVEPITAEMVKKYYDEHPEKYGGGASRSYEMVFTERAVAESERAALLDDLRAASSEKDWQGWVEKLKRKGRPLVFRAGELEPKALDARLAALVKSQAVGATSAVSFVDGRAYVVRVTRETPRAGRSLSEVSREIREALLPIQAKKAVKRASEIALKETKVQYL